jgi:hypothetical protein
VGVSFDRRHFLAKAAIQILLGELAGIGLETWLLAMSEAGSRIFETHSKSAVTTILMQYWQLPL